MSHFIQKPETGTYPHYYDTYLALVPEGDILNLLETQMEVLAKLADNIPANKWDYRYGPEKWTVKELIGHCIDTERIMAYRAMCMARGEAKELPGFDENQYVAGGFFAERSMEDLAREWVLLRQSNLVMFRSMNAQQVARFGSANGLRIMVKAFPYILAGHQIHHFNVLAQRYGVSGLNL